MVSLRLEEILPDLETVDSFLTFRTIEDWCYSNIPKEKWRFDNASRISAFGVDIPGKIIFYVDDYYWMFRYQYCVIRPDSST